MKASFAALLLVLFLIPLTALASDGSTVAGGGGVSSITAFSICKKVTNSNAQSLYVPTASSGEWSSFYSNPPAGVAIAACLNPAYFVLVSAGHDGNLGGLSGANSYCYTRLNADSWLGKATSSVADSSKVKAFLCDGTTCQNTLASTTYNFASTTNATYGGATFTTDGSGLGPNDSASWVDNAHFGALSSQIWTNRASTSATQWANTRQSAASNTANCAGWTTNASGSGTYKGATGNPNFTDAKRWLNSSAQWYGCPTVTTTLICTVDP